MDRILNVVETGIVVLFITVAFVCGVMQVVLRYAFNTGFPWTEGILITVTVWACLMAGSRAVRDGLHVRVEIAADSLPRRPRLACGILVELVCIAFTATLCYGGWLYTHFVWSLDAVSPEAYIAEWMIYGVVPVSMAFFTLRHLQRLWQLVTRGATQAEEDLQTRISRSL